MSTRDFKVPKTYMNLTLDIIRHLILVYFFGYALWACRWVAPKLKTEAEIVQAWVTQFAGDHRGNLTQALIHLEEEMRGIRDESLQVQLQDFHTYLLHRWHYKCRTRALALFVISVSIVLLQRYL